MANLPFNIAKGRAVEFYNRVKSNDPAGSAFIIVLLKTAEADAVLQDYADLGALLLAAGNVEADFTNYARKVLTDAELAAFPAPDNTNDVFNIDIPDQVFTAAGGTLDNTLVKALICYDNDTVTGTDTNIVPVAFYDFGLTTAGTDFTIQIDPTGFYQAA